MSIRNTATGTGQTLQTVSVGRFDADGNGNLRVKAVFNFGGLAILNMVSRQATYSITDSAAGTGSAVATFRSTAPPESPLGRPPGLDFSAPPIFEFRFVINKNKDLDLIGTKLSQVKSGQTVPMGLFVARGVVKRQTE